MTIVIVLYNLFIFEELQSLSSLFGYLTILEFRVKLEIRNDLYFNVPLEIYFNVITSWDSTGPSSKKVQHAFFFI